MIAPSDDVGLGKPLHQMTEREIAENEAMHDRGFEYDSVHETDLTGRELPGTRVDEGAHQPFPGRPLRARRLRFETREELVGAPAEAEAER